MKLRCLWGLALGQVLCLLLIFMFYMGNDEETRAFAYDKRKNSPENWDFEGIGNNDAGKLSPPPESGHDPGHDQNQRIQKIQPKNKNVKFMPGIARDGIFSPLLVEKEPHPYKKSRSEIQKQPGSRSRSIKNTTGTGGPLSLKQTKFVLFNSQACKDGGGGDVSTNSSNSKPRDSYPILLVLVQSQRNHFFERQVIRNTYGSVFHHKGMNIRVLFLLGRGTNAKLKSLSKQTDTQIRLAWEFYAYGDIIMGPFIDNQDRYSPSTTYSHVMGIRWALQHCNRSSHIVIVNDAQFVDTLEIVERTIPTMKDNDASFFCEKKETDQSENRWSKTQEKVEYCSSGGYLADYQAVSNLFQMISNVTFHEEERDDVFVTGRLRQAFLEREEAKRDSLSLPLAMDSLKILSPPVSENNGNRCFFTEKFYTKVERFPFHKYKVSEKSTIVKEFWCLWWNALSIKGRVAPQEQKFVWATMAQ